MYGRNEFYVWECDGIAQKMYEKNTECSIIHCCSWPMWLKNQNLYKKRDWLERVSPSSSKDFLNTLDNLP